MASGAPRVIEANRLRLRIHAWGEPGRPSALLLHSLAAHSHWWDWSGPLLAERFSVVALDMRGHGGSGWSDAAAYRAADYAADYAADVVAVLDHLGWRRPLVIGHSLGGFIGAHLAARHPERVGALVITDSLTQWSDDEAA